MLVRHIAMISRTLGPILPAAKTAWSDNRATYPRLAVIDLAISQGSPIGSAVVWLLELLHDPAIVIAALEEWFSCQRKKLWASSFLESLLGVIPFPS